MRLFLPQATLESWLLEDKADYREGQLQLLADGAFRPATPAVHFTRLVSGKDTLGLLNKVKPEAVLASVGAERMGESVLVGETAYEVTAGYLTEFADADVPESSDHAAPGVPVEPPGEKPSEQALLEAMLLDRL